MEPRADERIAGELAEAYEVALRGGYLLRRHYPYWFDEYVSGCLLTLERGLGAICAFFQLVEQDGCPLRWPENTAFYGLTLRDEIQSTPEQTLHCFDWVSEEWMTTEIWFYLMEPRPHYHGIGVQSIHDESLDCYSDSPLVAMLWQLFSKTALSLGVTHLSSYFTLDEPMGVVFNMKPLPSDTPIDGLCDQLRTESLPGHTSTVQADLLIRYALGRTNNALADHSDSEAAQLLEVDEWDWSQLDQLREDSRNAQLISSAFAAWDKSIQESADPLSILRQIAAWLHRHARAARIPRKPKTLIALLAEQEAQAA